LGKCFFKNFHSLPGIRYLLFDFVLSFDMETLPFRWIVANPVLSGFVSSFNPFSDRFLVIHGGADGREDAHFPRHIAQSVHPGPIQGVGAEPRSCLADDNVGPDNRGFHTPDLN
jgi:hypothetical protein